MSAQKLVFIIGAGASRSISPDIPVMRDFFEKCLPYLKDAKNHPAIWLAFAILEETRCFSAPNERLENAAAYIMTLHWHLQKIEELKISHSQPEYQKTEKDWLDWIKFYHEMCQRDDSRTHANLENVFTRAEKYLLDENQADNFTRRHPYTRLVFAVSYLFSILQQEHHSPEPHAELARLLSEWLKADPERSATFISFNYDVWLERSLQVVGLWHPHRGYHYEFERFSNLPNARASNTQWDTVFDTGSGDVSQTYQFQAFSTNYSHRVIVLKPHGSLNWYWRENSGDCVVLLEGTENSLVTANEGRYYLYDHLDRNKRPVSYTPFIVPPVQLKRRQHPVFWQTDQRLFQVLSEADTVVSIGWSMPETDIDYRQKILHAMEHRSQQLRRLLIFNDDPEGRQMGFYLRFESVFRPAVKTEFYGKGFTPESIRQGFEFLNQ